MNTLELIILNIIIVGMVLMVVYSIYQEFIIKPKLEVSSNKYCISKGWDYSRLMTWFEFRCYNEVIKNNQVESKDISVGVLR